MRTAVAIRHVAFEDLGTLQPVLERRGWRVRTLDAGVDDLTPAEDAELLVVLGGPIGARDGERFPVVGQELALLRRRLAADRPTLGICLGAQLVAAALGARISTAAEPEIGYGPVRVEAVPGTPLAALGDAPVLHWHGEQLDLPGGAVRLAATDGCANQAFAVGDRVLGLQFHLEVDPARIEPWLIAYGDELARHGIEPGRLRADAARYGPDLARRAEAVLAAWLAGVEDTTPER